jgi:hypothetical protein
MYITLIPRSLWLRVEKKTGPEPIDSWQQLCASDCFDRFVEMSASHAALSKYQVPYAYHGYGYPAQAAPPAPMAPVAPKAFLSGKVAEDLRAEETYLENRRKLQEDLRKAETNEGAAVDKRVNDERVFEVRSAEAHERFSMTHMFLVTRPLPKILERVQRFASCGLSQIQSTMVNNGLQILNTDRRSRAVY